MAVINKALFAAAAALLASLSAVAEDARGLLERMEHVLATRNYQGTFVHEHDGRTETMKIVHRAENGDFAERVVSLDGSRREAVQRDGELRAYFPDQQVVLVEGGPKGGLLLSGLAGLDSASEQLYRMSEEAPTRISGREARVIAVEPQDNLRYGYRVWIDATSAMPVKTESHMSPARWWSSWCLPSFPSRPTFPMRRCCPPRSPASTVCCATRMRPGPQAIRARTPLGTRPNCRRGFD